MRRMRALAFWMLLFERLAHTRGWRGLMWRDTRLPWPLLMIALGRPWRAAGALLVTLPVGLLAHMLLASIRRRTLDPQASLRPGICSDRIVQRIDIAMDEGHLPALYIVPHGSVRGAVAVLHGSGCHKTYYAWLHTDALLAAGCAVLLIDLDGHGENPRVQQYPQIIDDAHASVAWLRQRHAVVGLLGISLGGCIAARAVADGARVDGLLLLETPVWLRFGDAERLIEARNLLRLFVLDVLRDSALQYQLAQIRDLVVAQRTPAIRAVIGTADLIAALDLPGSLARCPLTPMLIYGARDAIVGSEQLAVARTAAPTARVVLVPDAGHLTLMFHGTTRTHIARWAAEMTNLLSVKPHDDPIRD